MNDKYNNHGTFNMQWEIDRCDDEHKGHDHYHRPEPPHQHGCGCNPLHKPSGCNCKIYTDHQIEHALKSINIVHNNDKPEVYTLMVGNRPAGDITVITPDVPHIEDIKWSSVDRKLSITFGGETFSVTLDGIGSIPTYIPGEGISIVDGVISATIDTNSFISKKEADNFVKYANITTQRKAIVLELGDSLLGTDSEGNMFNLIYLDEDKKVNLGNQLNHTNIISVERPTVNNTEQVAYLNDVNYVREQVDKIKSDIPSIEGLVTEENFSSYKDEINDKFSDYVTNETFSSTMAGYATTESVSEQIETATADMVTETSVNEKLASYATKEEIKDFAVKQEVDEELTKKASTEYVDEKTEDMATQSWVNEQNFVKEHQSLEEYAKKTDVTSEINKTIETLDLGQYETKSNASETYQEKGDYALKSEIPSLEGYAKEEQISDMLTKTEAQYMYQPKGDYLTEHQDLSEYAKSADVTSEIEEATKNLATKSEIPSLEGLATSQEVSDAVKGLAKVSDVEAQLADKQEKGDYVEVTTFDGSRKTIQLNNRDSISGKVSNKNGGGGVNLIMLSGYEGLDFDVTEVGSTKTALVLNTCEGVVKIEGADHTQKTIATTEDVANVEGKIPSLEGLATSQEVTDAVEGLAKTDEVKQVIEEYAKKIKSDVLSELIQNGVSMTLSTDLHISGQNGFVLTNNTELDLGGKEITADGSKYGDTVVVGNGANVTLKNGTVLPSESASLANASATILVKTSDECHLTLENMTVIGEPYAVYLNNANPNTTITIKGGEYYTNTETNNGPALYIQKGGKAIIEDGTFGKKGEKNVYLLNLLDSLTKDNGKDVREFIIVKGGKFYNFNPAEAYCEPHTPVSFVADGYKAEASNDGDDVIYTVVPKTNEEVVSGFTSALKNGGDVILETDVTAPERLVMQKAGTVDLNGKTLTSNENGKDSMVITGASDAVNVTIKNGTFVSNNTDAAYGVITVQKNPAVTLEDVKVVGINPVVMYSSGNGTVTINSGEFISTGSQAVYYNKGEGKVTINGGIFKSIPYEGKYYTLNILDTLRGSKDPREFIEVKGGKFYNFNPMDNETEGPNTNYVTDGYTVKEYKEGEDTVYEVVKA